MGGTEGIDFHHVRFISFPKRLFRGSSDVEFSNDVGGFITGN